MIVRPHPMSFHDVFFRCVWLNFIRCLLSSLPARTIPDGQGQKVAWNRDAKRKITTMATDHKGREIEVKRTAIKEVFKIVLQKKRNVSLGAVQR